MALTLTNLFGANASLSGGVLSITLSDFSGIGLDGTDPSASDIAAALILNWKANQGTDADQDPTIGVTVGDEFRSFLTRGEQAQIEYQFPVSLYVIDNSSALDPDDVV